MDEEKAQVLINILATHHVDIRYKGVSDECWSGVMADISFGGFEEDVLDACIGNDDSFVRFTGRELSEAIVCKECIEVDEYQIFYDNP